MNDAFRGDNLVLSFIYVMMGLLHMLSKELTLTKAQIVVMWAPQLLATTEQQVFGKISQIGWDQPTEFLCFIAKDTIKIYGDDVQQQRDGFDIRVLEVRLESQEALLNEEEIAVLDKTEMGDGYIENNKEDN